MDISLLQFAGQYGAVGIMVAVVIWREWAWNDKLLKLWTDQLEVNKQNTQAVIDLKNMIEILKEKIK